ncbi:TniQ family protein [Pseudomonas sp. PCH199]|uniref:TniQ family protein n=1 Tax=unclassified Pseudomonas TaxID=196821 RepID=UPI0015AF7A19|nr:MULTISPECIES: TniQ family protein [unclassified Pseudomonas]MCW8277247.1 TniQ family protein [Pseudomonas sp. PCH199]
MSEFHTDESVSSWICRQIFYAKTPSSQANSVGLRHFIQSKQNYSDLDYFYSLQDIVTLQEYLPIPVPNLISQSAAECWWTLPTHRNRIHFCPQCAIEDLAFTRVPVWRRNWLHWWYLLCDKHYSVMRPLTGQYCVLNVVDRSIAAMKMVIDGQSKSHSDNDLFGNLVPFSNFELLCGRGPNKYPEMQLALTVFSKMASPVQAEIASYYSIPGLETPPERVTMILDLLNLLLRRHVKGIDPPAYAYQLFNVFFWRPEYQYNQGSREDVASLIDRACEGVDPFIRLVAMAIASYLLDYPNSDFLWGVIADSSARLGALVPDSRGWLYAVICGPTDIPLKSWYIDRIATYSTVGRDQCLKFTTAPCALNELLSEFQIYSNISISHVKKACKLGVLLTRASWCWLS